MLSEVVKNDPRALMIWEYMQVFNKLNIFNNTKSIINVGSFDLIEHSDINVAHHLLQSVGINDTQIKWSEYIDKNRISSKILWEKLGCDKIDFIDPDGAHNSFKFDLNYDIQEKYNFNNTYDIVTNFGTTEHIFNQYMVFRNIHNLCNINGYMIHSLPLQGAFEHGLYNYHPNFFMALADTNEYKLEYFGVRYKGVIELFEVSNSNDILKKLKNIDITNTLGSLIIFKKTKNNIFQIPFQKRYEQFSLT